MYLYGVCDPHIRYPELGNQFKYIIKGEYLAGYYAVIYKPPHEIRICPATQGNLCFLNTELYPVEKIKCHVYVLFTCNCNMIGKQNLTINLEDLCWFCELLVNQMHPEKVC